MYDRSLGIATMLFGTLARPDALALTRSREAQGHDVAEELDIRCCACWRLLYDEARCSHCGVHQARA